MDSLRLAEGPIANGKMPKQIQWMRVRDKTREREGERERAIGFGTTQEFKLFINDRSI